MTKNEANLGHEGPRCRYCDSALANRKTRVCAKCGHFQGYRDKFAVAGLSPANLIALMALTFTIWQASIAARQATKAEQALVDATQANEEAQRARAAAVEAITLVSKGNELTLELVDECIETVIWRAMKPIQNHPSSVQIKEEIDGGIRDATREFDALKTKLVANVEDLNNRIAELRVSGNR